MNIENLKVNFEDLIQSNNEHPYSKLNTEELLKIGIDLINKKITHCTECETKLKLNGPEKNTEYLTGTLDGFKVYKLDNHISQYMSICEECGTWIQISLKNDEVVDVSIITKG